MDLTYNTWLVPVVFIEEIQRRERWVPRKGTQSEMGREKTQLFRLALCRVLQKYDWGRVSLQHVVKISFQENGLP